MSINFAQLIDSFLSGMTEDDPAAISSTGTLRIKGEQLIHYFTPIAERWNGKIIVNTSRYSLVTGRLQKQLKELIPEDLYIPVRGVREAYKGSLSDFLKQ